MSLTGDLNATYKVAYAKGVEDLTPKTGKFMQSIDFVPADRQNGKDYEQPVILAGEQGFTYSLDTQSAYDLNNAIGMTMAMAIVPGADIVLDSLVGYNQAARANHSATSFRSVMGLKFENMLKSSEKRLDCAGIYGQDCLSTAAAQAVVIASSMLPIVFDADEWAMGMWTGSQNAQVVFAVASDNTAVDSLRSFTVAKIDPVNRTVYFSAGTQGTAGTLTTLETAIEAAALKVFWYGSVSGSAGSFAYAEMAGIKKQMTNTGTLFGIDAATYDLWQGNTVTTTGQLTMSKVLAAIAKPVQRGLDSDVDMWVNPDTWADLASNLAALRRFDGSYSRKKGSNGTEELEYVSQNGTITIRPYNMIKAGDCFIYPKDNIIRIGAAELSLQDPTKMQGEIFFQVPGKAGVGVRSYTNQAVFIETPAQCVYITGFSNSNAA